MHRLIAWFKIITFTVLCLFILTGCEGPDLDSDPIKESEIYGKYVANYNDDRLEEFVELREDSIYIHYTKFDDLVYIDTGVYVLWKERDDNSIHVNLRGFVRRFPQNYYHHYDPYGKIDTASWKGWGTYIKKGIVNNKIIIYYAEDYSQYYYKVDSLNKE